MNKLLTAAQLAAIHNVSKTTILDWHSSGRIPSEVAEGRVIRFDADKVAEALKARSAQKAKRKHWPLLA